MTRRFNIFFGIIAGLFYQSIAQQPYTISRINGLSQNTVFHIFQDKKGFLWAATGDGLNRYDGNVMCTYKPGSANFNGKLNGYVIRGGLFEDDEQKLYFSTERGMHQFDLVKNNITPIHPFIEQDTNLVKINPGSMPLSKTGSRLWFFNATLGIGCYDLKTKQSVFYHLPDKDNRIIDAKQGSAHLIWLATSKGLYQFHTTHHTWNKIIDGALYRLAVSDRKIYCSRENKLLEVDLKTHAVHSLYVKDNVSPSYTIKCLYVDPTQQLWAGDFGGNVYRFSENSNRGEWICNINGNVTGKRQSPVFSIYIDCSENLWLGSDGLGLMKMDLKRKGFQTFPVTDQSGNKDPLFIWQILEQNDTDLLLNTANKGLLKWSRTDNKLQSVQLPFSTDLSPYQSATEYIMEDSRQNILAGYGLQIVIKRKGEKLYSKVVLPSSKPIHASDPVKCHFICEADSGWWVLTSLGIYKIIEDPQRIYRARFLFPLEVRHAVQFSKDCWLLCHPENGLYEAIYQRGSISTVRKLLSNGCRYAVQDQYNKSMYWIAASDGLIAFKPSSAEYFTYNMRNGLSNSFVYGVIQYDSSLWLSTNGGLSRVQLHVRSDAKWPAVSIENFDVTDGLQSNEFNTLAFAKGKKDIFYFGGIEGVTWFDPTKHKSNKHIPKLVINRIEINNKSYDTPTPSDQITHLHLKYNHTQIALQISVLEMTQPLRNRLAYRIMPLNENWVDLGNFREIRIANLDPGTYRLEMKACNNSGIWMDATRFMNITVMPPYWQTYVFRVACLFLLVFIVWQMARFRHRKKHAFQLSQALQAKALAEERERIARDMHDEIGAGITRVVLLTEAIKKEADKSIEQELKQITDTGRNLVLKMSDIIWSMQAERKTWPDWIAYVREKTHSLLEYTTIGFQIDFMEVDTKQLLTHQQVKNMTMIIFELVNNAIRHSEATSIHVKSYLDGNFYIVEVSDNGKGFSGNEKMNGNGLHHIQIRIQELQGKFHLYQDTGTRIVVAFPIDFVN